jgi:putative aldouronate transport system substrate-binding protein
MKKQIRFYALVCSLLLVVSLFAGCSGNTAPEASPSAAPEQSSAPEQSEAPAQDEYVYKMPIADSVYTITAWRAYTSTYLTSPNEILANIELEKRTNIHLDYKLVPQADAVTQYNLFITSGDYTDIIFQGMNGGHVSAPEYSGGLDKAITDGVLIELSDAVDKWMPNLKEYMANDDEIRKQMHTDAGNIGAIVNIQNGKEPAWVGPMIRKDFMDKVGVSEIPQTYDDLYNVLTKFKSELNLEQPLSINFAGYSSLSYGTIAGFDVSGEFYNENGTVKFGIIEPGFKEYITLMNKWYSEGLIDPEFFMRASDFAVNRENMLADKIGVTDAGLYAFAPMFKGMSTNPDFKMVAIPFPRKTADAVAHFRRVNEITGTTAIAVSTAVNETDKLEKIARWIDYRFSEEGAILLNYGIEGQTFDLVDDKPRFNDAMLKDSEGRSFSDMQGIMTDGSFGCIYDWSRGFVAYDEETLKAMDIWGDSSSGDWVMPPVALTSDEGTEYSNIYGDIQTLVTETVAQFISGAKPMSEFDGFVEQVKSMNIERCIEIQQAALDRYLNR